jgi:hypothetical protein
MSPLLDFQGHRKTLVLLNSPNRRDGPVQGPCPRGQTQVRRHFAVETLPDHEDRSSPSIGLQNDVLTMMLLRRATQVHVNIFQGQIDHMRPRLGMRRGSRGHDDLCSLMGHNMNLRLGRMMLNGLDLLVHSRLLVMNDWLRLVFLHDLLLVGAGPGMRESCSRALGRRRCGCR